MPHKLVRVLKNNLRPEIRHELLNIEIRSVSELREIFRRRKDFWPILNDIRNTLEALYSSEKSPSSIKNYVGTVAKKGTDIRIVYLRDESFVTTVEQPTHTNRIVVSAQKTTKLACRSRHSDRRLRSPFEV